MSNYELVAVLPGSFDKERLSKLSLKIKQILKDVEVVVNKEEELGLKKLAYPVKHEHSGYYYIYQISISTGQIKELRRLLNFETQILRYLLLKVTPEQSGK